MVMADVEAMFHQVRVHPKDVNALRFLWFPHGDLSAQPCEYQMLVHLFGGVWSIVTSLIQTSSLH